MGKSVRKYRKNRDYDYVGPDTTSAYAIHDGHGTGHGSTAAGGGRHHDNDLLSSPREFVPLDELAPGDSSSLQAAMLLITTSVGASVVATPFAFLQGGFVMTIAMLLFLALASYAASVCLVQLGVAHGIYSLQGLAKLAFGHAGAHAVTLVQLAVSCGLVLAYMGIVFQDLPVLLGHALHLDFDAHGWPIASSTSYITASKILANRTLFAELMAFLVVIPLCVFTHTYAKARGFALVTTLLLVLTSLCIVGKAKSFHDANAPDASQGFDRDYLTVPATVCQAFGILATQVASQHHAFHAFYALRARSVGAFAKVLALATLGALYLAYSFGIGGYVAFLGATKSDVVQNVDFANDNRGLLPFWLLVPLCALLCIPLEVVSSRYAAVFLSRSRASSGEQEEVLFRAQPSTARQQYTTATYESKVASGGTGEQQSKSSSCSGYSRVQVALTVLVLAILVQIVALVSSLNIATMLSVTGGIAGIALIFVVPPACFLKLSSASCDSDGSHCAPNSWVLTKALPWSSIVVGIVASVACVIANIAHHA